MVKTELSRFQQALDVVESLSPDDQETLVAVIRRRLIERRRAEIARRYNESFARVPELQIPHDRDDCQHAWHLYMLRLRLGCLRIDRAQFVHQLKEHKIGASVHFIPLHLHPYYRDTYGYQPEDFPVAHREYRREISLPIYSRMTGEDVQSVVDAVTGTVEQHRS